MVLFRTLHMGKRSEERHMNTSFWDILEGKIKKEALSQRENPPTSTFAPETEIPGLAWLMGQKTAVSPLKTQVGHKKYGVQPRPPRPRPDHKMSSVEHSAYMKMARYCSDLRANFTESELKKAWKTTAKRTHPDLGGTSEAFREMQQCYEILKALLPSGSKP